MTTPVDTTVSSGAPLAGRSVVVTRSREQASELADGLEALGAKVLAWPVIRIVEPEDWGPADEAIRELSTYDWAVFTSTNAVDRFFERLGGAGLDARALSGLAVAAVGTSTASRLATHGVSADYVPRKFVAEGVLEGFIERGVGTGSRVLVPRALEAREVLPETLREHGATVDVVPVYRNVIGETDPVLAGLIEHGEIDVVTFTSGSTVANFVRLLGEALPQPDGVDALLADVALASIGPVTTQKATELGLEVTIEAEPYTVPGLVAAIAAHFART